MEVGFLLWRYLDDVYLRVGLTHSFISNGGYDFISTDGTS